MNELALTHVLVAQLVELLRNKISGGQVIKEPNDLLVDNLQCDSGPMPSQTCDTTEKGAALCSSFERNT